MFNTIINLLITFLFLNTGSFQLNDPAQIITNPTMPKRADDVIINKEEGDISREIIYPTIKNDTQAKEYINAKSALIIDVKSGLVLYEKNSKEKLPIASITKLMTALVFLDEKETQKDNLDWNNLVEFNREDFRGGRRYLGIGEKVSIKNLFSAMLVGSANSSTMALVRSAGLSEEQFVEKMNQKTIELNMTNTHFEDPTGLNDNNTSTARDLAKLVYVVMQKPEITERLKLQSYEFSPINKNVTHRLTNTNWLLSDDWFFENTYEIIGGKTGYTDLAGFSFVSQIKNKEKNNVISVILNTNSANNRFEETKKIVEWSFNNYNFNL